MEHRWILEKVGGRAERVSFSFCCFCQSFTFLLRLALSVCHSVNMCKCLFSVVWQLIFYGFAFVRGVQNIQRFAVQFPQIAPISRRILVSELLYALSHGFVTWLTTYSTHSDITAFIHSIYTCICICFSFPTCYTKFINQERQA